MMQLNINLKTWVCCVSLLLIGASQHAIAAPASLVAWDAQTRNFIKNADLQKGEVIAQTCISCHGVDGSKAGELLEGFPSLAGQRAEYIFKQLMDYKQGKRVGLGIMPNFVANLDKPAMASVATWFSKQDLPIKGKAQATKATNKIVFKGDSARFVPACSGCHGLKGEGSIVDVPALAGMSESYFKVTMNRFKRQQRHNDIYQRMRQIAQKLSADEINDVAKYYSSIGK